MRSLTGKVGWDQILESQERQAMEFLFFNLKSAVNVFEWKREGVTQRGKV